MMLRLRSRGVQSCVSNQPIRLKLTEKWVSNFNWIGFGSDILRSNLDYSIGRFLEFNNFDNWSIQFNVFKFFNNLLSYKLIHSRVACVGLLLVNSFVT